MKNCDGALLDFRTSFFSIFSQGPGFPWIEADIFFHALDFVFHGLDFAENFHGNILFFTGCLKDFFTGRIKFSRVEN